MGMSQDLAWFYAQLATMQVSERYREATLAELYDIGKQYEGLPDCDDKSYPFRKRKPRIIIPLFKEALDEISRFTWGGHNFPTISVEATRTEEEGEDANDVGPRLDKKQAEIITKFVRALMRAGQLERSVKEASREAGRGRSAALILGIRGGYVTTHIEPGKHCTPTWHKVKPRRLEKLEIEYQYPKSVEIAPGRFQEQPFWYRREITSTQDITYKEVPVVPGVKPQWVVDPDKTVGYGYDLGEAPAVWFRTPSKNPTALDGEPIIDPQLYPLIDDVNYTVSQRSRAIKHVTDPQAVISGLDEGDEDFVKSPDLPWFLPDPAAKAQFLETSGIGIQRATEHVEHLTEAFRAAVHYVKANPKTTSGHISGVVLEFLHAPMIALASDLRSEFGENGLVTTVCLLLQIINKVTEAGQDVWVQGVGKACKTLAGAQLRGVWLDPPICLHWAPYFPETSEDKQQKVGYTVQAEQGKLISRATAIKHVSATFNVEDTEAEEEAIEQQADEDMNAEVAAFQQKQKVKPPAAKGGNDTVPEEGET